MKPTLLCSRRHTRALLVLAMVAVVSPHASAQQPVDWIRKNAIPLQTVEAGNGFNDMQPLKKVVGDARIVALGEATHGTREFFQLKHRMIEFLASQMGFTIFSIEANMPEAYRLNDFVLNGNGDPKQLLKGMYFWTWNTEEVLNMILWMREFNRSGKGRIEFTGFDMQTPTIAMDIVRTFVTAHDRTYEAKLNPIYSEIGLSQKRSQTGFGLATTTFPVKTAAGKHITYSGYIKTEGITEGYAGLWWRVDGEKGKILAFDNMQDRGVTGTTPWTRYEISLDVPANATNINFGVLHSGNGTAWFDSLDIKLDGQPFTDPSAFDLEFESSPPHGYYIGGRGYQVTTDNSIAHSGKQSLRSTRLPENSDANSSAAKVPSHELAVQCRSVLEHLTKGRSEYLHTGVEAEGADWIIQNARVVMQYALMQAGEQTRDQSMADNVEWIAAHNPGSKIVLWAHNGHIKYSNPPGFDPMGGFLHKKFGQQLVNFGFSFNEGSFRAIETGKGMREFTVRPLAEESLDRALASTGFPLLALDLRRIPKTGPVAKWFAEPHPMRSIGAMYDEKNPDLPMYVATEVWPQDYEAILFVEKTTAARPISESDR
jgi:erythromycin esterase-like protein